jgi:hypothetical protein
MNQYVPEGVRRGSAPECNTMARFTALMWGAADGTMGPPFIIIKCAATGPDLRSARILDTVMQYPGFTAGDGWEMKSWQRSMPLVVRGKEEMVFCARPYLVHADGCVITLHPKAWMDSAGMAMWMDVQLGPWAAHRRRRTLVVWDNCGPHGVPAVGAVLGEHDIRAEALPPRMTSALQVMDLVVNGPLKAAIRRTRVDVLLDYFQEWKFRWAMALTKPEADRVLPAFAPPKPRLTRGTAGADGRLPHDLHAARFPGGAAARVCKGGLGGRVGRALHGPRAQRPSRRCCDRPTRPATTNSCWAMRSRN